MTLNVEPVESILRVFHGADGADSMERFDATGTVHYCGDVAVLYGFHGNLKAKDIFEIYRHLHHAGANWLMAHRKEGHTIPLGQLMPDGWPFSGWWCVDLKEFASRGK